MAKPQENIVSENQAIYSISRMDRAGRAVEGARNTHKSWADRRKALSGSLLERSKNKAAAKSRTRQSNSLWRRETFRLPRDDAREKARSFFAKYPKAAYWTEIENWRVLEDDMIEFTMRRLPSAD